MGERPLPDVETVEHGGDIGLVVRGGTEEELFLNAARGLFSLIVTGNPARQERLVKRFSYMSDDDALVEFLNDLLFWWDTDRIVPAAVTMGQEEGSIYIDVDMYHLDRVSQQAEREVKGVTYHGFSVMCRDGLFTARFVIDL